MNRAPVLVILATAMAAGCHLPPPTTVRVDATNSRGTPESPPLVPNAENIEPSWLKDQLAPMCDLRSGKPVNDDKKLAKALAGVGEWQKVNKKSPPKPPEPVNPNQGPVTVNSKGVG